MDKGGSRQDVRIAEADLHEELESRKAGVMAGERRCNGEMMSRVLEIELMSKRGDGERPGLMETKAEV